MYSVLILGADKAGQPTAFSTLLLSHSEYDALDSAREKFKALYPGASIVNVTIEEVPGELLRKGLEMKRRECANVPPKSADMTYP